MSQYDMQSIYEFLQQTPEQGLRKMLVDGKPMTEVHFNLLMKVVRSTKLEEFATHFEKEDFPKIKLGPAEQKLKEKFWKECTMALNSRGLLGPAMPVKIAA